MPQTAQEQLILEMINRARLDPAAEAARLGISLNEGLAAGRLSAESRQPLAGNSNLTTAARNHSTHMLNTDRFGHEGIGDGSPGSRMTAAGYSFTGAWTRGENIAFNGTTAAITASTFAAKNQNDLFIDKDYAGRGHRISMLNGDYREVGIGLVNGVYTSNGTNFNSSMLTQDFARSGEKIFVTGVAINDNNANNFYDIGEGRGSVAVTVRTGDATLGTDVTESAGGYGIAIAPRSTPVFVKFSGGGLASAVEVSVTGATKNVKVDLLGSNEILSSASTVLGAGAVQLGLLGTANLNGTGNASSNVITGNKGANILRGEAGADTLNGQAGNDVLVGGAGRDVMTGGSGNDTFRFLKVTDTGVVAATRDLILDFKKTAETGTDKIDLAEIDAKAEAGLANDTFVFLTTHNALFTAAGQVRWVKQDFAGTTGDRTIIMGNTDADADAEFHIEIRGLVNLTAADFVL